MQGDTTWKGMRQRRMRRMSRQSNGKVNEQGNERVGRQAEQNGPDRKLFKVNAQESISKKPWASCLIGFSLAKRCQDFRVPLINIRVPLVETSGYLPQPTEYYETQSSTSQSTSLISHESHGQGDVLRHPLLGNWRTAVRYAHMQA